MIEMNELYQKKYRIKIFLLFAAIGIGVLSLVYTNSLVSELRIQEREKVALFAKATKQIANADNLNADNTFLFEVIRNNKTVPVILTDQEGRIIATRNLDSNKLNKEGYLQEEIGNMKAEHQPIEIPFDGGVNTIYYRDSFLLKKLQFYPLIMLTAIALFLVIAYLVFSSARKAEQNRVWVGMAKETAHQIGTPLSSLMGWIEILRSLEISEDILGEMSKDIKRLNTIAQRFSKIGSVPEISEHNLVRVTEKSMLYIKDRSSKKVNYTFNSSSKEIRLDMNISLYEWVIENLLNNALDAMEGKGDITINIQESEQFATVDISDSGKGIKKSDQQNIFNPGFTTKSRGWGLGLSLAKRIIEGYHKGQISVLQSEPNKGTTFRIKLKKS